MHLQHTFMARSISSVFASVVVTHVVIDENALLKQTLELEKEEEKKNLLFTELPYLFNVTYAQLPI